MKSQITRWLSFYVAVLSTVFAVDQALAAGEPQLVKDIGPGFNHGYVDYLFDGDGILYFAADDGIHGHELWRSDGTEEGTHMVKDIRPGSYGASFRQFEMFNGELYFPARDGSHGYEIWKSDGTETGTMMLLDMTTSGPEYGPSDLTVSGENLFFVYPSGWWYLSTESPELYKTDGTSGGTVMVKDINPINNGAFPDDLIDFNGVLLFSAPHPTYGAELWRSDGSEAGTWMVKDINPGIDASGIEEPVIVNGTMYFRAHEPIHGQELWKTDGTEEGTQLVKDIFPGNDSSFPTQLTAVGNTLFFIDADRNLWKSDGTSDGTVMVANLLGPVIDLTASGDLVFFVSFDDHAAGFELWKSDGTSHGTRMVKDIYTIGTFPRNSSRPDYLTDVNGRLYFSANHPDYGSELWTSDGTEAGTYLAGEVIPGPQSPSISELTNVGGTLFFEAYHPDYGYELWSLKAADADGDGIADDVDGQWTGSAFVDESATPSDNFTDQHIDGASFGYIQTRADLDVTAEDHVHPGGLLLQAKNGGGTAHIRVCDLSPPDGRINLTNNDAVIVTCGSMLMEVLTGPVEVELGNGIEIIAPTDGIILVTEIPDGTVLIENLSDPESGPNITIMIDGKETVLGPEETLQSMTVDVMPGNDIGCINAKKKGSIPAAILGSAEFQISRVNPATCLLEGLSVRTKGKHGTPLTETRDINHDGFIDLIMPFGIEEGAFEPGQTSVNLSCALHGEEPTTVVSGSDTICVVK